MDIRLVRDNLGRCKASGAKGESLRAAVSAISALKDVVTANAGANLPTDVRGLIRECAQMLGRDPVLKPYLKAPLVYQAGQEKTMLVILVDAYKKMLEASGKEARKEALDRKQGLDRHLNSGMRLLGQGNVAEADAAFQEALNYYKDESVLFLMISKALVEAGQHRRAYSYLKRGLAECSGNVGAEVQALYAEVQKARGVADASETGSTDLV